MNITLDRGNSLIKIAVFDDKKQLIFSNQYTDISYSEIDELFELYDISQAIYSSVADEDIELKEILKSRCSKFIELNSKTNLPITIEYSSKETLGKDRVAAAVGAATLYPNRDLLVIDAGSCITIDSVDSKGTFLGGNISPGIWMRLEAMHHFTKRLPKVEQTVPNNRVGNSTQNAIICGAYWGVINELIGYIKDSNNDTFTIITGGDSFDIYKDIKDKFTNIFLSEHLVLIGLNEILNAN